MVALWPFRRPAARPFQNVTGSREARPDVSLVDEIIYIEKSLRGCWRQELQELVCLTFLGLNGISGATAPLIKPRMQRNINIRGNLIILDHCMQLVYRCNLNKVRI